MGIQDIKIRFKYSSFKQDFKKDFYEPLLKEANVYDRSVGYFSSKVLSEISDGLKTFVVNGGKMRIICSPHLSSGDIEKVKRGFSLQETIEDIAIKEVEASEYNLNDLAWLIKYGILDMRFALLRKTNGLYHEKVGIISDQKDTVAFWGSNNETYSAIEENYEIFTTAKSWERRDEVLEFVNDFEEIWCGLNQDVEVFDISEALKGKILKVYDYRESRYFEQNESIKSESGKELFDFQEEAIYAFFENERKYFYEMATGTGKTFTTLMTVRKMFQEYDELIVIITVPQSDLLYQWSRSIKEELGITPILVGDGNKYRHRLEDLDDELFFTNKKVQQVVLCINDSLKKADVQEFVQSIPNDKGMIIVDESHNLTPNLLYALPKFENRLGLSATPNRNNPDETKNIREFFGGKSFVFDIQDAIKRKFLANYEYNIIPVVIDDKSYDEYKRLTIQMIAIMNDKNLSKKEKKEKFEEKARNRALKVKNTESKYEKLEEMFFYQGYDIKRSVVYCGAGKTESGLKHRDNTSRILGSKYKVTTFTSDDSGNRPKILSQFQKDYYDALIAIKCLDEGVDIPSLEKLYILSSDKNYRQTVQRRGRVLRRFRDKEMGYIYDMMVLPPSGDYSSIAKSLVLNELLRVEEYSRTASNKDYLSGQIDNYMLSYDISEEEFENEKEKFKGNY